ncbi:MAG: c-type cytochrome [Alphaproteobacteria bacterium]
MQDRYIPRRLGPLLAAVLVGVLLTASAAAHEEKSKDQAVEKTTSSRHEEALPRRQPWRLLMPRMDSARGRKLFAAKGCVICHAVNGVGGHDAPPLDAHTMGPMMNPFEFAAKMWRGAAAMIVLQEEAMGVQILFTGDELADIIAFAHDDEEQHKFSEADIPPQIMPLIHHTHGEPGGATAHGDELGHMRGPEAGAQAD